jgi:hypothetical protein
LYGLKGDLVRKDNGSQFIANMVRQYLRSLKAHQEYTHIATPKENSNIEEFHSILDREFNVLILNEITSQYRLYQHTWIFPTINGFMTA